MNAENVKAALSVIALAATFALVPRATRGCEGASIDKEAPNFVGTVVANGEKVATTDAKVSLSSLRGHVVLLDFWATWCGPCQAEGPIIDTIAERYKDRGLVVLGVNTGDEPGLAERYVKRRGIGFPQIFDHGSAIARAYGASALPTLVVISKEGRIVALKHGVTSDSTLDEIVRHYL